MQANFCQAWNEAAWRAPPAVQGMPGALYRDGLATQVCPDRDLSSLYKDGEWERMPPVGTEEDRKVVQAMFRHQSISLPGEVAGDEGTLQILKSRKFAKIFLTRLVDLDLIYHMLLTSPQSRQWFMNPRMPPVGYKRQPWRSLIPYELLFDSTWTIPSEEEEQTRQIRTYTLGITDQNMEKYPGTGCMLYLKSAQGADVVMARLLGQLDEGLIHPFSKCFLR